MGLKNFALSQLPCRAPQGSVSYVYMKPLGKIVWSFGVQCHQFVDDYLSLPSKSKEAPLALDQCLVSAMDWMQVNKLNFRSHILCSAASGKYQNGSKMEQLNC